MIKGKIVLVPFPFDDLSGAKVRPAVCLTEPIGPYRHVVLAFLTSHVDPNAVDTDLVIDAGQSDFAVTGLRTSSTIRLHRLMTAGTALFQRELGILSAQMQADVAARLRKLFRL